MAVSTTTGSTTVLSLTDIDEAAVRIGTMWDNFTRDRILALQMNEEVRSYIFATDINTTTASNLAHKNRTHQPKLTQIYDGLCTEYFNATMSEPEWFKFEGESDADNLKSKLITDILRFKLEQISFRETIGRQYCADFTAYGNVFGGVDYVEDMDNFGRLIYKGPKPYRTSPLDITFNCRASSFDKAAKVTRALMHISELSNLANQYPNSGFKPDVIAKVIKARHTAYVNDWIDCLKSRMIAMDGYGGLESYYKQDMVELLIYRGDMFNPDTGETQRNRVVYVVDRVFIIRNEPALVSNSFKGIHHAAWRPRIDNLWGQGPLDNVVGMQYRIDHLENLKADVFDIIAQPALLIKGEEVQEPVLGYGPGARYYCGNEGDVKFLVPDATALNADTQIATYHRMMEELVSFPSQKRGIRTPGEKTAFEVDTLDKDANAAFLDKARILEHMLEGILNDCYTMLLANFDESDLILVTNDITAKQEFVTLSKESIQAQGRFRAIGSRFWEARHRKVQEMQQFMQLMLTSPKTANHVSGLKTAQYFEEELGVEDAHVVSPFAGVIEDVQSQAAAEAEKQSIAQSTGIQPQQEGDTSSPQPVQPGQQAPSNNPSGMPGLPGG